MKFNYQLILTLVTFFSVSTAKSEGRRLSLRRLHDQPVETNLELIEGDKLALPREDEEDEMGPVDTNFEAENEMGPVDTNFKGPVTTNFAVSWGDSTVTTNESGDVVIQKTNRDLYCKSFPEGKNKEDLAITLIQSTTWRDYIGSMYFQASYAMLNDSEEKNICSISIEVPKSNEDMKVFLSAGVEFDKERTSKGELKSDLLNKSVYMEPADSFSFFYTLSERTDSVESTAAPLICVKDFEYCTEKQTEDRVSLHDYSQQ